MKNHPRSNAARSRDTLIREALALAEEMCEMNDAEQLAALGEDYQDYIEVRLYKLLQRIKEPA